MSNDEELIFKNFGNKLRIRVCGICIKDDKILLIKHKYRGDVGFFWAPPGGGMNFGESVEETLLREFKEETGLDILIKKFLFVCEFKSMPLHAIELFFEVEPTTNTFKKGKDPELSVHNQIIEEVVYVDNPFLQKNKGPQLHGILNKTDSINAILNIQGYYKLS